MIEWDAIGYMVIHLDRDIEHMSEIAEYQDKRRLMRHAARNVCLLLRHIPYDWKSKLSGGFAERLGLVKAISFTHNGGVRHLVVDGLESLCLTHLELAVLMLAFRDWSVEVWDATTETRLDQQLDRWHAIVQASDPEARLIAERGLITLTKQATRLWNNSKSGRRPYGESLEEKRVLERIWQLRRKKRDGSGRTSYSKIADELNSSGERPPQGKKWHAKTIQGIVKRTKPHLDKN